MIDFDGRSYTVDDPTTNAYNILTYVNNFMIENEVKKKDGTYVQFKISLASPIWLIIFGIGYMATVCQKIMYAVAQAFNIGSCSDSQVLELAKVARVQRKQGSYTTVVCTATAGEGNCYISTSEKATVTYSGESYDFYPMYDVSVAAGQSAEVIMMCSVTGPVYLSAGAITKDSFATAIVNLSSFTSSASQPGSGLESIKDLRTRLFNKEAAAPLDSAYQGLNALDGVTRAVILFNDNYDSDMLIAGHAVPPKKAIVFVQGFSPDLAKEYYKHMTAQTVGGTGSHSQSYTLLNGQNFTMNYFAPEAVSLYIKVYVKEQLTLERETEIKNAIVSLSNTLVIGQNYTQAYVLDKIDATLSFPEIIGCELSADGEEWANTTDFDESNIGLIASDRITITTGDEPSLLMMGGGDGE